MASEPGRSDELYRKYPLPCARSIRVLDIKPAFSFYGPVIASMRIITLPTDGQALGDADYQTLSYSWQTYMVGRDPGPWSILQDDSIVVDGYQIPISGTLCSALRRIREKAPLLPSVFAAKSRQTTRSSRLTTHATFTPTLWVDAVCINQKDVKERGAQVKMMGEIYRLSHRLIIWLGELSEEYFCRDMLRDPWQWRQSGSLSEAQERYQLSLKDMILRCRWFSRRWVLQEVLNSDLDERMILYGAIVMKFKDFAMTSESGQEPSQERLLHDACKPATATRPDLLANLLRYLAYDCSEPHDRVYALLGISTVDFEVPVDYSMAIPELNLTLAREYVQRHPTAVMAFVFRSVQQESVTVAPTWIPDWSVAMRSQRVIHHDLLRSCQQYTRVVEWDVSPVPKITLNPDDTLSLMGWIFRPCQHLRSHIEPTCLSCVLAQKSDSEFDSPQPITHFSTFELEEAGKLPTQITWPDPEYNKLVERFKSTVESAWPLLRDGEHAMLIYIKGSRMGAVVKRISSQANLYPSFELLYCFSVFRQWLGKYAQKRIRKVSEQLEKIVPSQAITIV